VDGLQGLALFDDASDCVVAFGDDNRFVYANKAALRIYELSALTGRSIQEFAAEPVEAILEEFHRVGFASGEVAIRTGGGEVRRVRYRGIANYAPKIHVSIVRSAEATVPRPANGAPRATLFHAMFENAPDATLLVDDQRRYLAGNSAARRFLGVSRETLLASRLDDFTPPSRRRDLDQLWEAFLTRGSLEGVFPLLLPNGLQRTVLFRATANVTPGRHLSTLQAVRRDNQPAQLGVHAVAPETQLTFRERELLTLIARGGHTKEIAEQVSLSPETVRTHVRNAMRKLEARTRPHAIALAIQQRQIDP
jgi:DNA-binding CsgD family transcriptional regulator/PAS domain-containing protein